MHNGSHPRINRCADTYKDVKLQLATVTIRWRNRAVDATVVQTVHMLISCFPQSMTKLPYSKWLMCIYVNNSLADYCNNQKKITYD